MEWTFIAMRTIDWKKAALLSLALFAPVLTVGCEKDPNSAGGIGQKVDKALDPRGPAEKIGDKVDGAVGK